MHYILYGGQDSIVFGVSESCYKSFGISAKLASDYNTNFGDDFTIDKIFPEIFIQNVDLMKSPGVELRIDTTLIPQEYHVEHSDNSDLAENDE